MTSSRRGRSEFEAGAAVLAALDAAAETLLDLAQGAVGLPLGTPDALIGGLGPEARDLEDAVFYGNEGRIRLRTLDRQSTQAAALALVSSAIVTWNTHHMNQIIERAAGRPLDDLDLARLSPALHAHINLNGRYHINPDQPPRHLTPGRDALATYQ